MSPPAPPKPLKFGCDFCDQVFTKKYNLTRHIIRKHILCENEEITPNSNLLAPNSNLPTQNSNLPTQNSNLSTQNSNLEIPPQNDTENICPNCYKHFTRSWCLTRHIEKCTGEKSKFQCEHCQQSFQHEKSRFRHYKICAIKKEKDEKALIPVDNTPGTVTIPNSVDTLQQANTINNIATVGTQNNIENQQNNVIIVYNPGNTEFKTDHLKAEDLQRILQLATPYVDSRAMTEYTKKIFSHPENRCIKKEDIKSGHSEIHIGDNQWELELDRTLYPKLASDMANNMSEFLHTKRDQLRREVFDRLTKFVDYMADEGYINTDDLDRQREIQKEYTTFMKGLKLIVYGKTRGKKK